MTTRVTSALVPGLFLAVVLAVAAVACSDGGGDGPVCGAGTVEQDGACVLGDAGAADDGGSADSADNADSTGNADSAASDTADDAAASPDGGGSGVVCGPGTTEQDGVCVADDQDAGVQDVGPAEDGIDDADGSADAHDVLDQAP